MNALARSLQDLHYMLFGAVVKLSGGLRSPQKSFALASALGAIRSHFGYIGPGWSRKKYLGTIRAVFPQISAIDAAALLKAYWVNHQKRFMELFLVRELTPQNLERLVEFSGLEHLDRALERKRGVILPVPHIGNERLHHIALAVKGYPLAVISSKYEDHGEFARKIKIEASRRFHEVGYPGDTTWLLKMLKQNRVLQVASTAEPGPQGVIVNFLGQKILLPTGWVRLALRTEAAVLPSTLIRQADDRHLLVIHPEIKLNRADKRKIHLQDNVQRFMDIVAEFYRERPDLVDWMALTVRLEESQRAKEQRNLRITN